MLKYWVYKCSEHLCFHNCSYEYKITLFILLDAAYCLKLCFVWQSHSRFFFCLHLPSIALPTLESFYFRWVSCINLIWEPLSSNKGMVNAYVYCLNHFGWPLVILFCVFCISFLFWLLSHSWWFLLPSAVIRKGDILFLTPLVCILLPPIKVLICLCVRFVSSSAYLSLALLISRRWHPLQKKPL